MVLLEVHPGKKGPEDRVIKIWAYGEILTFHDILYILDIIFKSEDSIYPINQGFQGKAMLMKAILEVYSGIPLEHVLKVYRLKRKTKPVKVITKIHEVL